jgi:ATP-binding cassette subfamily B protein
MSSLKKLLEKLETKYIVTAVFSPIAMIGEVSMEVYIPLIMARIIDVGIKNSDLAYTAKTGLLMILMAVLSLGFGTLSARLAAIGALGFAKNLRNRLFLKVQNFSFSNIDKFTTPSLITRLTTDVTNLQNLFMMAVRTCIRSPVMLISAVIMSIRINVKLSIIFLCAIPVLALFLGIIIKQSFPKFQTMFKKYDNLNASVQENLNGIRVVKAYVRGKYENLKFECACDDLRKNQIDAEKIVILNIPLMQITMSVCTILVIWFGARFIIAQTMQTGQLISFITYNTQVLMSLMMISMIFISIVLSRVSIQRILEVLQETTRLQNKTDPISQTKNKFSIEFENVSFSYNEDKNNTVLENICLKIEQGTTVGILGGTGSSKTTLVSLIPRLYDVLSGSVKIAGIDVKNWDMTELRKHVAFVLQNNLLFSQTIRENLKWGNEDASDEEIEQACKIACADEFIERLPEKYDTVLSQGGTNLSGGQKQRLCIARALLKKSEIIIFDDSTSAVDTATEKKITKALKTVFPDTTKIFIAQRISSVKDADVILVMDAGRIVDSGKHEELLSRCDIYREVYETQNR